MTRVLQCYSRYYHVCRGPNRDAWATTTKYCANRLYICLEETMMAQQTSFAWVNRGNGGLRVKFL